MDSDVQFAREVRIARDVITRFSIDLRGMNVVTEAATGHFRWTPVLALMAGAERVTAVAHDSRFGSARKACDSVERLASRVKYDGVLETTSTLDALRTADIVTNLRALRPFDERRLSMLPAGAALPLMCESWEYRSSDLDLTAAFARDIVVLGTNEHHPALDFMKYVGLLAVKLGLDAGVELYHSRVVVVGGGDFGLAVTRALRANGSDVRVVCPTSERHEFADSWLSSSLNTPQAIDLLSYADLLVFADYTTETRHIGGSVGLQANQLAELNPSLSIVHISGLIDANACRTAGLQLFPEYVTDSARTMSVTTALLGARPVLELHGAGLKVGEVCARAWRVAGGDAMRAREIALYNPLCQEFPNSILARHSAIHPLEHVA